MHCSEWLKRITLSKIGTALFWVSGSGNSLPTLRDNLSVTSSRARIESSGNVVRNYHYSLGNNPEDRSSHLLRGGSLKSFKTSVPQTSLTHPNIPVQSSHCTAGQNTTFFVLFWFNSSHMWTMKYLNTSNFKVTFFFFFHILPKWKSGCALNSRHNLSLF